VVCVSKVFASQDWINWVKDENYRRELVLRGETFANVFLSYRRNFRDSQQQQQIQTKTNIPKEVISLPVTETNTDSDAQAATANAVSDHDNGVTDENTSFEIHNNDDMTMV
jgi:hypothetical protein